MVRVTSLLKSYEAYMSSKLTENAFIGLIIHLAIAVQRIERNENIFMENGVLEELKRDSHFAVASEIGNRVEKAFGVIFPEAELGYITMHLKGSKLATGNLITEDDIILSNFDITRLAVKMIQRFKEESGYDFHEDEKLLIGLVSHLKPAITRMKLKLDIRNPLLENIKEMYPDIFAISGKTIPLVKNKYDVEMPEAEIGYLTMHFGAAIERQKREKSKLASVKVGVVCASGIGTSSLLNSRLSKNFPEIKVIGQFSREEIDNGAINQSKVDLLISTIKLTQANIPWIRVNPLLLEEDLERISQIVGMLGRRDDGVKKDENSFEPDKIRKLHELTEAIIHLESGFKLVTGVTSKTTKELIDSIAKTLGKTGKNKKKLLNQFKERERLGSTVLKGEGVILIHSKSDQIDRAILQIWRLEKGIEAFDGEMVETAIVMCLPINATRAQVDLMSQISKALVDDDYFISAIKNENDVTVESSLKKLSYNWLEKQMQGGLGYDF